MIRRNVTACVALCVALLGAVSCTAVPLEEGAADVRVATLEEATKCQRLGRTTSTTTEKVWIFPRTESAVKSELESLARNQAVDLGGTVIAPMGPMNEGKQLYGIFRCKKPVDADALPAG
jgi:hypothetical protein